MQENNTVILTGQATDKEIADWKKMWPQGIYAIMSRGHIAYFRRPNKAVFNHATFDATAGEFLKFWETFADTTFIGGSKEILNNDLMFRGAMEHLRDYAYGLPTIKIEGEQLTQDENLQSMKGYAQATQVAKWMKENEGVYAIVCGNEISYFKLPTRKTLNEAQAVINSMCFLDYWEAFANDTFLGGSNEYTNNDEMFRGMVEQFKTVGEGYEAELVKL